MNTFIYFLCIFFALLYFRWKLTAKTMIKYYHDNGVPKISGPTFRRLAYWAFKNWFDEIFEIDYKNHEGKMQKLSRGAAKKKD